MGHFKLIHAHKSCIKVCKIGLLLPCQKSLRKCVLLCIFSCYENNFSSKGKITEVTRSESFALKHNRGSRTPKGSDHHFQMHSSCLCQSKCSFVSSTRKSTLVLLVLENSIDIKLGPVAVIVGNVTIKAGCHR
jgi:hypothetical protein